MTGISIGKNITFNGAKFSIGAGPQPREHRGAGVSEPNITTVSLAGRSEGVRPSDPLSGNLG
jgi:hypothetical protein